MTTVLLSKWTNTLCACRSRAWIRAWNFEPQPYIIFVHNFPYQGFLPVWHHIFLSTLQFCLQGPFSYLSAVASILFTDGSHAVLVDVFELWTTTVQLVWPSPLRIKQWRVILNMLILSRVGTTTRSQQNGNSLWQAGRFYPNPFLKT